MAKFDLDSLSIEELAALRESATAKLFEKVAAREAELEKLARYGRPAKKPLAAPLAAKPRKAEEKKAEEKKADEKKVEDAAAVAKAA